MKSRRQLRFFLWALCLGLGTALVWFGVDRVQRRATALASLPARPALPAASSSELAEKIAAGEQAARSYLHSVAGLTALSRLYHANGFYNEAAQCYGGLQQLQPGEARWPHLQSSVFAEFGRLEDALPLSERAVRLAPDYLPARLRLGDILLKANQTALAAKTYSEVAARQDGNPYALLGLAKCSIATGDWARAREHLSQAVKLHPDFIGGLSLLVTVEEHFGDQAKAAALQAAIGKKEFVDVPDPWLESLFDDCYSPYRLSVAAAQAHFAGDRPSARRWLERAIALAPKSGSYCRQLGSILLQAREFGPAREYLQKAVTIAPDDSEAWILLVTLFTSSGDAPAALQTLTTGLANCPQSPALHHAYGQRLVAMNRPGEAIAEFSLAKKLRPNEANAYIDLALVYFQVDRVEEAIAELRGALRAQPGHPLALGVLARYAIDTNDEKAARHWIGQLRQQPRLPAEDLQTIVAQYRQHFGHAP